MVVFSQLIFLKIQIACTPTFYFLQRDADRYEQKYFLSETRDEQKSEHYIIERSSFGVGRPLPEGQRVGRSAPEFGCFVVKFETDSFI